MINKKNLIISYFSLFTSLGTLFCCALPSFFVLLGMGASFAGLVGTFPQIVWLSEYKITVFVISGFFILLSFVWLYKQRNAPCPIDVDQARACMVARRWSLIVTVVSFAMWLLGFFSAFILPKIFNG